MTYQSPDIAFSPLNEACSCTARILTCLHTLVIFIGADYSHTWLVVRFVDGRPEALVAAPSPDDSGARPVERDVSVERHLGNSCLEALQGTRLLQTQRRSHIPRGVALGWKRKKSLFFFFPQYILLS